MNIKRWLIMSIVLCLCGGLVCFASYNKTGNRLWDYTSFTFGDQHVLTFFGNDNDEIESKDSEENSHYKYSPKGDFNKVEIDAAIADIEFVQGNTFEIETWNIPEIGKKNKYYEVDEEMDKNSYSLSITENIQFQGLMHNPKLKITIPKSVKVLNVESELGDVSLTGISLDESSMNLQLGNLTFNDVKINHTVIDLSLGDLNFTGSIAKSMEADLKMGDANVILYGPSEDYQVDADTEMGEVKGIQLSSGKIPVEIYSNMGNITVEYKSRK